MDRVRDVPRTVEEITPAWMQAGLSRRFPGVEVADVTVEEVLLGTAVKVLVGITYSGAAPEGAPGSVCVKGGFGEERVEQAEATAIYESEAIFYSEFEHRLPRPGPIPWFSQPEPGSGFGVVVLEDMLAQGATFGRPTTPFTVDQVAAGLQILAGCHARTWEAPFLREHPALGPMVSRENAAGRHFATFDDDVVRYYLDLPLRAAVIPTELDDPARIRSLFWSYVDQAQDGPHCLSHGDPHVGNWYVMPDDRLGLLDWQTVCRMRWAHDVAYFVGSALDVSDRRAAEQDLLRSYLDAISGSVGDVPGWDEAWLDYRRSMAYGLMAWLTSREWMNPEEVHAASIGRFARAVLDLDTEGALADRCFRAARAAEHDSVPAGACDDRDRTLPRRRLR